MPNWSHAPIRVAHAVVLFALGVGPSQASARDSSDSGGNAGAFTQFAHNALSGDAKARALRLLVLNQALDNQLLAEAEQEISADAVATYHRQYEHHFRQPEALALWRLLVASETQARELLNQVQKSSDPIRAWSKLVREHSLDKATHFRRGSLGYVWPDGNTDVPQVRVAPELYEAAKTLKDGELLPRPMREGQHWALVWRRDTRAAKAQPPDRVQAVIRQQLALSKARSKHQELTTRLRGLYLTDYHPEHLDSFRPSPEAFSPPTRRAIAARPADHSPVPRQTDLGER